MSNIITFNKQTVISSSSSWTVPTGVNVAQLILAGGGGGGFFLTDGSTFWSASGGGGGQVRSWVLCLSPGNVLVFVIGNGGTGYRNLSNVSGSATAGGNSYVYILSAGVTTLASAISTTTATTISNFTSTSGLTAGQIILIDSEQMLVQSITNSTTAVCIRGWNGTTAATHSSSASVGILNLVAFALGGVQGVQGTGGAGGGSDPNVGAGASTPSTLAPRNGAMNIAGGGGAAQSNTANGGLIGGQGPGPSAMGGLSNTMISTVGTGVGGGGSWGAGGHGDTAALPGTGGGGGSGKNGGSGVAALMWQAA